MTSAKKIIDDSFIGEIKERMQEIQNVVFDRDCSTKDEQPTQTPTLSSEDEGPLKSCSYIGPELPICIDNNFSIVIFNIISCSKCTSGDESDDLKVLASSKDPSANINIINNYGLVVVTSNGEFNFDGKPNKEIQFLKLVVQDRKGISEDQEQTPLDGNKPCESHSNKNVKNESRNRSEFCPSGNASQL